MDPIDFTAFGGAAYIISQGPDAGETAYNFGIDLTYPQRGGMSPEDWSVKQATAAEAAMVKLPLREWDGKTSTKRMASTKLIKHNNALGDYLKDQYQPTGTCVGRGASGAINVLQALMISLGYSLEWKPVSHAWCYAGARIKYGMLGGGEGAVGKGAFEWCRDKGVVYQEEAGDTDYYSDTVATKWGRSGIPGGILTLGTDNLLEAAFPVTTAKQAADVLYSGGAVTIASNRGFRMTRDADGVCQPSGVWNHQMHLPDVRVTSNGRKIFDCVQSWGANGGGLSGPRCPDQPNYVFGIDWSVVDSMLRQGDSMGACNFGAWYSKLMWAK